MRQFNKYILYIILSILITFAWVALPVCIIMAQEQESSQSYEEELEQRPTARLIMQQGMWEISLKIQ